MRKSHSALALVCALAAGPALAQSGAEIGVLTCQIEEVKNAVIYTSQTFACGFEVSEGVVEGYSGKITKIGLDLSIKNDFTIVWAVFAPTDAVYEPSLLAGTYVGVGADVTVGVGVGAKVLVGGGENSISLQPLSVAGVTGGGVSIGVESFELK